LGAVKHPETPFQHYLAAIGDEEAARRLGVKVRTVKSWRLGDRVPRPEQARAIVGRAPVTLDDIYGTAPTPRAVELTA
jgi:DNA-binding transcriptional regulator YdaS (Cro superfamily)